MPDQWQMGHIMENTNNKNNANNINENVEDNDNNDAGSIGTVNEVETKLGMITQMTQRDKDMMDQTGRLMLCHEIAVELDDELISIEELPQLSQRTNDDEDSDSEDEEEEDQLNAANKDDLEEAQDTNVG
ncbi:MAG: hypothetical protein GY822_24915, partial [Deltaproteobacteria bacterium]|nr:hypothetical protein [Deltaproteobacteria bacterium]